MYKLSTNKNYTGSTIYPKGTNVNVRKLDANNNPIMTAAGVVFQASTPSAFGVATGRQIIPSPAKDAAGKTIEGWMEVKNALGFTGFVRYDLMTRVKPVAVIKNGDGKAVIDNIVARDYSTFHKLLYNQELLNRLKKAGVNTTNYQSQQDGLMSRYNARRKKITDSKMLKLTEKIQSGFEWLKKPFVGVIQFGWVGALVIAGVAAGVTALALYNAFHTDAQAAEIDLKTATTLAELLEKTTPEEKKKVLAEINKHSQKQFDEGYAAAKSETIESGLSSGLKEFKNLLLTGGGLFLATKIF